MSAPSHWPAPPAPEVPPAEASPPSSPVLRLGTAVGLAAAAALVGAVPAALRVAAAAPAQSTAFVWIGLAAAALVPMIAAVVILRGAGEGLRAFAGPGAELRAYGMALWAAMVLVGLTYFGSVLRATTHHHALAGVTFAIGGGALAFGLGLLCARIVTLLGPASRAPAIVRGALGGALPVAVVAALGWVGMRFLGAASRDAASAPAAGVVVDVLAFVLTSLFAARRALATRRVLALAGPPLALAVAALGISALRDPLIRAAIDEQAPAFALVADDVPGP